MSDDVSTPGTEIAPGGQPAESSGGDQTTFTGPTETSGQPEGVASAGTTSQNGLQPDSSQQDIFFDPREYERLTEGLPSEVQEQAKALRKSLQSAFTKKTQKLSSQQQKIAAYDAFMANPQQELQRMASQYGLNLAGQEGANNQPQDLKNWQPESWEDVLNLATDRAYERLQKEQGQVIQEVQNLRKSNLEKFLDDNAPDWREFEDEMSETLTQNPSLINDPLALYRASVPIERIEGRAYQNAIKKLQSKTQSSQMGGQSTTKQKPFEGPDKVKSFDDAVAFAKAKLDAEGITP